MSDAPALLTPPAAPRGGRPSRRLPGRFYPGSDANRLHEVLVLTAAVSRLPWPLFAGLWCAGLALIGYLSGRWTSSALGALFVVSLALPGLYDAGILRWLPRARLSFGPAAPQFLLLQGLRGIVALGFVALAGLGVPAGAVIALHCAFQLVGCVLVWRAFVHEPGHVGVTRRHVLTPRLGGPLRILVAGDLHVERRSVREEQLQRLVDELQPDLLLFTGDFLNLSCVYDPVAHSAVRSIVREWHARYGIFAVTGSPLVDPPAVAAELLDGLPITWLQNQVALVGPPQARVRLVGVTCTHVPEDDWLTLQAVLDVAPGEELFTILLYHSPDMAPQAATARIDLQVSGHTHGGQVRLPGVGALVTSSLHYKRFEMGAYQIGGMQLYVARGIGLEGQGAPRARFLCEPEVVLWEIEGTADSRLTV